MSKLPQGRTLSRTTISFSDPAFQDADMIVIAPRQADDTNATPVSLDNIVVGTPCTGLIFESGLDNGDGSGTANDGILQSGEVDESTIWCN